MSKLVSLGQAPKSFSRSPKFTNIDGEECEVDITFKYMTPEELGAFYDAINAETRVKSEAEAKKAEPKEDVNKAEAKADATKTKAKPKAKAEVVVAEDEPISLKAIFRKRSESDAEFFMKIVTGWGLEEPMTLKNVTTFLTIYRNAMPSITAAFQSAIHQGHAGN